MKPKPGEWGVRSLNIFMCLKPVQWVHRWVEGGTLQQHRKCSSARWFSVPMPQAQVESLAIPNVRCGSIREDKGTDWQNGASKTLPPVSAETVHTPLALLCILSKPQPWSIWVLLFLSLQAYSHHKNNQKMEVQTVIGNNWHEKAIFV